MLPPVEDRTWPTPYVIKANHGSGWYRHVVTDGNKDWSAIERDCESWMRQRWHPHLCEVQYAGIAPQILVEERLGGASDVLPWDYKFRVFNGVVKQVSVTVGRLQDIELAMFDRDWNPLPFTVDMPVVSKALPKPEHYEEMLRAAELLARPFPFARIDFYDLPGGPRFGEVTLTPSSGFKAFEPDEWDFITGDLLDLSDL
jgi:TupA-like ATPgrasp